MVIQAIVWSPTANTRLHNDIHVVSQLVDPVADQTFPHVMKVESELHAIGNDRF